MGLFNRKKKDTDILDYNNYLSEFTRFKDSVDKINEYDAIRKLYDEIFNFYKNKINDKRFDIKIEKLLLERRMGKYNSEKSKAGIAMVIGLFCALVPIYVQGFVELSTKYRALIYIGSVIMIFYTIYHEFGKDVIEDKNKDVMYNVSLKVLADIEKEVSLGKLNSVNEEVAVTLEEEEKKEDIKQGNGNYSGNWNVDIHLPSIVSTFEDVYKVVKFINKLIKKKK
jgi:hypothetical protein